VTPSADLQLHLDSILGSTDDGIFVLNRAEEVVIFNAACERLTGLARDEVLGGRLTCDEVFRCHRFARRQGERGRGALPVVQAAASVETAPCALFDIFRERKEKAREEAVLVSRSGERHWVETSFSPVRDATGAVAYTVGVLRMVDDRKRAEREVQEKAAALERALAELRERTRQLIHAEKMASIGQLAAGVAHELNTPLNTILGYSQMLAKQVGDPALREECAAVESATKRCRDIVQSLLSFSRKSDGFRAPRRVNKVIGRAVSFLKHDLERKRVRAVLELEKAPLEVVADENQLEQVFLNLASNAIDAMPEGGRITVRTERRGDRIAIEFADTGTGIAPEALPRIWEPFYTTKAAGKGTGLGLPIVARIVEEHGGTIEAASEQGSGTTFTIVLPLAGAGRPGSPE
jgi:signal transduction histidine kinase